MKITFAYLFFVSTLSFAQSGDFIILKKNNRRAATYYSGSNIAFTSSRGAYFEGVINRINNDTVYLQEFVIRRLPTTFGTYLIDTAGSYHYKFHYNEIRMIGEKERSNFNLQGSGASLLGGGLLLALGSGIVYVADRNTFSAPLLIAALALGTTGYFMSKGKGHGIVIGKKYSLVYMDMSVRNR